MSFKCPFHGCGQTYSTRSSFRQHMRKHDRSRGDKVCPICSCVFKKKSQLRKHLASHKRNPERDGTSLEALESLDLEPYSCDLCGKKFVTQGSLLKHKKRHEKTPFSCDFCEEKFSFYHDYQKHVKKNHPNPYECELCSKRFKKQYLLNEHIKAAHTDMRYRCEECGKTYKSTKSLNRHKKVKHDKSLRFICPICKNEFAENCVLKRHLRQVHKLSEKEVMMQLYGVSSVREDGNGDFFYDEDEDDDEEEETSVLKKRKRELEFGGVEFEKNSKKRKYDNRLVDKILGK